MLVLLAGRLELSVASSFSFRPWSPTSSWEAKAVAPRRIAFVVSCPLRSAHGALVPVDVEPLNAPLHIVPLDVGAAAGVGGWDREDTDLPEKFAVVGVVVEGLYSVVAVSLMVSVLTVQLALSTCGEVVRAIVGHRLISLPWFVLRLTLARQQLAVRGPRRAPTDAPHGIRAVQAVVAQATCGRCGCSADGSMTSTLDDGDGRGGSVFVAWITWRALPVGLDWQVAARPNGSMLWHHVGGRLSSSPPRSPLRHASPCGSKSLATARRATLGLLGVAARPLAEEVSSTRSLFGQASGTSDVRASATTSQVNRLWQTSSSWRWSL